MPTGLARTVVADMTIIISRGSMPGRDACHEFNTMSAATAEQIRSIQPDSHVWVMASAGSGKTHVLSQRVLRLLLEGERPESILCLTFTKAAAAEMSNRVFKSLADMVHKDDARLKAQLHDMGVSAERAAHARTLFARTLDARGGLKIQTIHGFCQSLLARYPLEAELPPGFGTLDDMKAALWMREALESEMRAAMSDTQHKRDWTHLATMRQDGSLIKDIGQFTRALEDSGAADLSMREALHPRIRAALGLPRDAGAEDWFKAQLADEALDRLMLEDIVWAWSQSPSATLLKRLEAISLWRSGDGFAHFDALWSVHSTAGGDALSQKTVSQGKAASHDPDIYEKYLSFYAQLQKLHAGLKLFALADDTAAMARVCWGIAQHIGAQKNNQGLISFADLVRKAGLLMQDPMAQWVLYKMDDKIRHILVDESQDTNSLQWRIIDAIAAEFFTGEGAAKAGRTIFAVGDDKQSIYGFQGSEPFLFSGKRAEYQIKSEQSNMQFNEVPLSLSFRSSPTVIDFVNASMEKLGTQALGLAQPPAAHQAFRHDAIGSVTLWQPIDAEVAEALIADVEEDLTAKWRPAAEQALAFKIADQIDDWLSGAVPLAVHDAGAGVRAVRAEDILILVQKRSALMTTLVSALKAKGVAVAGVDRIKLLDQLVIKDVLAVVQFVLLPQDDLNLAALLKSPFLGFDEAALQQLCIARDKASLWSRLKASDDEVCQRAYSWLAEQLARADQMSPFVFLSRLLDAPDGRTCLLAALGEEALDPLNMLIDAALRYEQEEVASLQGFLHWLSLQSSDIKRDPDQARGQVRLMTVHGAKGLEAPVVILADSCTKPAGAQSIISVNNMPIWYRNAANVLGPVAPALAAQQLRDDEEYWRLYYVAITRAADHLFITGWRSKKTTTARTWHDVVQESLAHMGAEAQSDPRFEQCWHIGAPLPVLPDARQLEPASPRLITPIIAAPAEPTPGRPLRPSRLADAPVLPRRSVNTHSSRQRGIALHRLLQHLPGVAVAERPRVAARLLRSTPLDPVLQADVTSQVFALLDDPVFAPLFTGAALVEAPITALLPDGSVLSGQVDRLLIGAEAIWVVDYKSGGHVPATPQDVPVAYLRQMAAYRWALQQIWPLPVQAALLWTDAPHLMPLPDDVLSVHLPAHFRS
jgi:ATP-dependent helicase/nuclease subunit A